VLAVGLQYETEDSGQRMRGIGGAELVFVKHINRLFVGELQVSDFAIKVRAMDYGFAIESMLEDRRSSARWSRHSSVSPGNPSRSAVIPERMVLLFLKNDALLS
jgi:hypothetical protein